VDSSPWTGKSRRLNRPLPRSICCLLSTVYCVLSTAHLASSSAAEPAQEGWPTFRGGPARCGAAGEVRTGPGPTVRWRFHEPQCLDRKPFASSPALAGSRVLIGSDSYRVYCLDLDTGRPHWTFDTHWQVFSSPAVWNGRVYVGEGLHENTDSKLYCLDLGTGKLLWALQTQSHTESSPTVADGKVYFGAGDGGLYCADAVTGKVLWQHKGPHVDGCPLVADGRVYVGSGYDFHGVICLSAGDGSVVWKKGFPAPAWAAPSFAEGRLYMAMGKGTFSETASKPYGEVRCLDPKTGEDFWRFVGVKDAVLGSVAIRDGHAVFGSRDSACYALDAATGGLRWRTEVGSPILSSPAVAAGCVLFGADDGHFACLRLRDGAKLWSLDTSEDGVPFISEPRILSSAAVADGKVVFGSSNGNVYCLADANAALGEKGMQRKTDVSIRGDAFLINGRPTYEGRTWQGKRIEGLLLNSRMVQGIFDDLNLDTWAKWAYPDTGIWDAERNTREFVAAMPQWRRHGLLAFTINLQGGSPQGYSREQPWHNSALTETGDLRPEYMARLERILDRADELGMAAILGVFYFGQDHRLKDEAAVLRALDNAVDWVLDHSYRNVLIEVNNECNVRYVHPILQPPRVHELIERAKARTRDGRRLLVSTSYGGGSIPRENVVRSADFLLVHGNGVGDPERIADMVRRTRRVPGYHPMPILFNEDDHFDFEKPRNNLAAAIGEYCSWGYFDPGASNYRDGYQCPPVDWRINTERKRAFFAKVREITGAE